MLTVTVSNPFPPTGAVRVELRRKGSYAIGVILPNT